MGVDDYYYEDDAICITYDVNRISDGYYCYKSIKWMVLGVCDGDNDGNNGCNGNDLNGLIRSFEVKSWGDTDYDESMDDSDDSMSDSGDRRRLYDRKYSKKAYGTKSDSIYGIRIDLEISDAVTFEVCLENVFKDDIEFSNNVRFRRGYNKYICNNEWVIGLP